MKKFLITVLLLTGLVSSMANASILDWTIQNATFNDGGTLSGTFSIDSTSDALVNYDLVTTAGSALRGYTYTPSSSHVVGYNVFAPLSFLIMENTPDPISLPYIQLAFNYPVTELHSVNTIVPSHSWECLNCSPQRFISTGYATTDMVSAPPAVVPEPGTYALFSLGLLGLGLARKRQQ